MSKEWAYIQLPGPRVQSKVELPANGEIGRQSTAATKRTVKIVKGRIFWEKMCCFVVDSEWGWKLGKEKYILGGSRNCLGKEKYIGGHPTNRAFLLALTSPSSRPSQKSSWE